MREPRGHRARGLLVRFAIVEVFVALALILVLGPPRGHGTIGEAAALARGAGQR